MNVLFVCSRNQWRSPTAEAVFRKREGICVRSGGTSAKARHRVSANDLQWADVVMVMEEKHKSRLQAEFGRLLQYKPIHVLDIPDAYQFMAPELIVELERAVGALLSD